MSALSNWLLEYDDVTREIRRLEVIKERLRTAIEDEMCRLGVEDARENSTRATLMSWFKLTPRRDAVMNLLTAADLFPFASFTANRVKEVLVPVYGRERLLPLFDIEKKAMLRIHVGNQKVSNGVGNNQGTNGTS